MSSFSDAKGGLTRHFLSPEWPLEMLNTATFTEQDGKTTLTINSVAINATAHERKIFEDGFASMQGGLHRHLRSARRSIWPRPRKESMDARTLRHLHATLPSDRERHDAEFRCAAALTVRRLMSRAVEALVRLPTTASCACRSSIGGAYRFVMAGEATVHDMHGVDREIMRGRASSSPGLCHRRILSAARPRCLEA